MRTHTRKRRRSEPIDVLGQTCTTALFGVFYVFIHVCLFSLIFCNVLNDIRVYFCVVGGGDVSSIYLLVCVGFGVMFSRRVCLSDPSLCVFDADATVSFIGGPQVFYSLDTFSGLVVCIPEGALLCTVADHVGTNRFFLVFHHSVSLRTKTESNPLLSIYRRHRVLSKSVHHVFWRSSYCYDAITRG